MICIGCGSEVPEGTGFKLQGVGWLCNLRECYKEFNAKREKMLAESCYGGSEIEDVLS
jgi:hypothetical protein